MLCARPAPRRPPVRFIRSLGHGHDLSGRLYVPARAAVVFASSYIYKPGTVSASYQDPAAALGKPNPVSGMFLLTPFNAAFQPSDMVGVGPGGSLTLKLSDPVSVGPGRELGVHAGVNLADMSVPNGQNRSPASTFNFRAADVAVSADGDDWVDLGSFTFNLPTNYYDQGVTTPGGQSAAGPNTHEADFGKPFKGTLSDFDGKNWAGTLAVLDGSAGGTWLDVTPDQIGQFQYVRFTPGTGQIMFVDAVAAVPEPAAGGVAALAVAGLLLGRGDGAETHRRPDRQVESWRWDRHSAVTGRRGRRQCPPRGIDVRVGAIPREWHPPLRGRTYPERNRQECLSATGTE